MVKKQMNKSYVKWFVIWLVAFFTLGIAVLVYSIYYSTTHGLQSMEIPDAAKLAVGSVTLLLFCPILCGILWKAKREKAKRIAVASICLLILICVCVIPNMITILF